MEQFPLILIYLGFLFLVVRPITVLFHELGHAIPAILLTRQKVTIYVGSYGDPQKSIKFNIGKLEAYFRYNPLSWRLGLCVPSAKEISINRQIFYVITGPVTSLLVAVLACYFAFTYDFHGFFKSIFIVFLGSSIVDLLINLTPNERPIKLYNGTIAYNDGYRLKQLFYYKRLPKEYAQAFDLYTKQQFAEAAALLNKLLVKGLKDEDIYRQTINCYLQDKNYLKVKEISEDFIHLGKMNPDDYSSLGLSYSHLGLHDKALEYYNKSLLENPNHIYSLNNKGFTLNLFNKYEEAIPFFDKVIELDKNFSHAYNNRGLSKIKMGEEEAGLNDINYSFQLEKDNAYGYRNLGIYHFDKAEYREALELFNKAKAHDSSVYMIDELIIETEQRI